MRWTSALVLIATAGTVTVGATVHDAKAADSRSLARTYVFYPSGKRVGWVDGGGLGWAASVAYNSYVEADKRGGYAIYEGKFRANHAYPRPSGQRRRYAAKSGEIFRRLTPTRWNVYRGDRLIAFTRGPDGVAAALAFVTWGDKILPH